VCFKSRVPCLDTYLPTMNLFVLVPSEFRMELFICEQTHFSFYFPCCVRYHSKLSTWFNYYIAFKDGGNNSTCLLKVKCVSRVRADVPWALQYAIKYLDSVAGLYRRIYRMLLVYTSMTSTSLHPRFQAMHLGGGKACVNSLTRIQICSLALTHAQTRLVGASTFANVRKRIL
jgi:hypothetical protein